MPPPLERLRALVPFLTAIVFGGLLRLWHLDAQVMGDDEWNAVGVAIKQPLPEILATFQVFDSSIPLTALFRFAMDHGVRLGEMAFRLPSLAASLALLCLAPAWVARRLGRPVAITFAWLLAASPLLVLYGRIARSYLPMTALAFAAVAAFDGWWREPSWRRGLAFSACAALAAWFHLGASTLVVSPFLFAGVALARRWDLRRAVATGGLAVATAAAFLLFLLPGRESLAVLIANKHQRLLVSLSEAARTAALLAGSRFGPVVAAFWVAAIAGLILLARRDRRLAGIFWQRPRRAYRRAPLPCPGRARKRPRTDAISRRGPALAAAVGRGGAVRLRRRLTAEAARGGRDRRSLPRRAFPSAFAALDLLRSPLGSSGFRRSASSAATESDAEVLPLAG